MLDFIGFLFLLVEAFLSDYIDVIVAILIIVFAVLIVTWSAIALPILYMRCGRTSTQYRRAIFYGLFGFFLTTTIFYYYSIPHDYVSQLGWRSSIYSSDFLGSKYKGLDKFHRLNLVHYNVILISQMDNWFLKERIMPSDDNLLDLIMSVLNLPALFLKWIIWSIWSFFLQYYWYFYPHVIGLLLTIMFLFARIERDSLDEE